MVSFCWVCRKNIDKEHYRHFDGENLFGCNGMQSLPQNPCCWVILLLLMILVSPFMTALKMGLMHGKYITKAVVDKEIIN